MKPSEYKISAEGFNFANENKLLHDKELVTKPKSYFRDAFDRFCKNKGSIVAAIVIGILVLYAIIAPICSQYTVSYRDELYGGALPKNEIFEKCNFWDGCKDETLDFRAFIKYYSMGVETGHNAIKNQEYTVIKGEKDNYTDAQFKVRLDSYHKVGIIPANLTKEQYTDLLAYQDANNVQIIYPYVVDEKRPQQISWEQDYNFWFETIVDPDNRKQFAMQDFKINEDGSIDFKNIYVPYNGNDDYTSKMRIEGDTPQYNYAYKNQTGYRVRVNYYEYYIYRHKAIFKDGIDKPCFLFGATFTGQDIFTCLASGARFSFIMAIIVASVNLVAGAIYGAIQGYYGGRADLIMLTICEILGAVPMMIVITLLKYHLNDVPQFLLLFIAFFATGWIGMAGTVRMQFYRFKNQEYVLASRTLGARDLRVMFKHIFPNALGTIVTSCVLVIPGMIFTETSLSYLGIIDLQTGNTTSVGTLLAGGSPYLTSLPHIVAFPAVFISLLMLSFNLFGNGLRDAFNPSLRGVEE